MSSEDGGQATKKHKEHGTTATVTDGRKTKQHKALLLCCVGVGTHLSMLLEIAILRTCQRY